MKRRSNRGFSLIELMIAILIGSIVLIGITSLFSTTSNVNRMENGLARLQENGRFAMSRIADDIRMTSALRGMRKAGEGGINRVSPDRPILSFVDFSVGDRAQTGLPIPPAGTSNNYPITMAFLIKGHECGASCAPAIAGAVGDGSDQYDRPAPEGGAVPPIGTSAGSRAAGADVLTVRYLRGQGIPLARSFSRGGETVAGVPNVIELDPGSDGLVVGPNQLIVIGDHATTSIISVAETGGPHYTLTPTGNLPNAVFPPYDIDADPRVSDFDADFVTVTYYLRLAADPNPDVPDGRLVSSLVRRENGLEQAIAEGIERLDFVYHVEDMRGEIHPIEADAVALFDAALCPPLPSQPTMPVGLDGVMCGWRSVRAVEVHLLANTVGDVGAHEESFQYSFLTSGAENAGGTVEVACDPAYGSCSGGAVIALASGLPPGRMLRREFRTTATVRNNAF
jgi:type IV pilus assembly protein PilW